MSSLRVIKYFIKSSPVGELSDVLDDISNIIGHDFLQAPEIKQALRDYYEAHNLQLTLGNGQTVIVAGSGRQEPLVRYVQSSQPTYVQPEQQQPKEKKSLWEGEDEEEENAQEDQYQQQEQPQYQEEQVQ